MNLYDLRVFNFFSGEGLVSTSRACRKCIMTFVTRAELICSNPGCAKTVVFSKWLQKKWKKVTEAVASALGIGVYEDGLMYLCRACAKGVLATSVDERQGADVQGWGATQGADPQAGGAT
jgi:hypothetical protein